MVSMLANDDLNSAALCCWSSAEMDVAEKLTLASLLTLSEDISDSALFAFFVDLGIIPNAVLVLSAIYSQLNDESRV